MEKNRNTESKFITIVLSLFAFICLTLLSVQVGMQVHEEIKRQEIVKK